MKLSWGALIVILISIAVLLAGILHVAVGMCQNTETPKSSVLPAGPIIKASVWDTARQVVLSSPYAILAGS